MHTNTINNTNKRINPTADSIVIPASARESSVAGMTQSLLSFLRTRESRVAGDDSIVIARKPPGMAEAIWWWDSYCHSRARGNPGLLGITLLSLRGSRQAWPSFVIPAHAGIQC